MKEKWTYCWFEGVIEVRLVRDQKEMDHQGIITYDTMQEAKDSADKVQEKYFPANKVVVVD